MVDLITGVSNRLGEAGKLILKASQQNLLDYCLTLLENVPVSRGLYAQHAFAILSEQLIKYTQMTLGKSLAPWGRIPFIQAGPHTELIFHDATLASLILGTLVLNSDRNTVLPVFACASVTAGSGAGPGWVTDGQRWYNVFGLPRKALSQLCAASEVGGLRFRFSHASKNYVEKIAHRGDCVEWIYHEFSSISNAIRSANLRLWRSWSNALSEILMFDEFFVSEILIHELQNDSLMARILLSKDRLARLLNAMRTTAAIYGKCARITTELFWHLNKGRRIACKVNWASFVEADSKKYICEIQRETIIEYLKKKLLLPDLFLCNIILSIIPRVVSLGGALQMSYYPLMQGILCSTLDQNEESERELYHDISQHIMTRWGMSVIRERIYPFQSALEGKEIRLNDYINTLLERKVKDLSRDFSIFREMLIQI